MAGIRRGTRVAIQVDERTDTMPTVALYCRRFGHQWSEMPQGAARRGELLAIGQTEERMICIRDVRGEVCGWTRGEIIELGTGEVIGRWSGKYPDGYLVKERGGGRLPRAEARKALLDRRGLT